MAQSGILQKINDLRIGIKISVGFGFMLIILAAVAWIGIAALRQAEFRSENVMDSEELLQTILNIQNHEERLSSTHDKTHADQVLAHLDELTTAAKKLRGRFLIQENREQMEQIIKFGGQYRENFGRVVKNIEESIAGETALKAAEEKMNDLLIELERGITDLSTRVRQEIGKSMKDRMAKSRDANQLRKLVGEAKALRVALSFKNEPETLEKWRETNRKIFDLTRDLKSRFTKENNIKQADTILDSYGRYVESLLKYLDTHSEEDKAVLAKAAVETMAAIDDIALDQEGKLLVGWTEADEQLSNQLGALLDAAKIMEHFDEASLHKAEFLQIGDKSFVGKITDDIAGVRKKAEGLKTRLTDSENIGRVAKVFAVVAEYELTLSHIIESFTAKKEAKAALDHVAEEVVKICEQTAQDQKAKMTQEMTATFRSLLGAAATALIVGCLIALVIIRAITRPLAKGVDFAKKIAALDLTARIDLDQRDEVGELVVAMNGMAQTLTGMVREINTGVETLSASSTEMSAIANQVAASAVTTATKSSTVAAAAEEMTTNMHSVAASMEEASANISTVAAATEEMSASIAEVAANTVKAKQSAGGAVELSLKASTQVNELGHAAEEIGTVTEAIKTISDKTSLLALNATIEAARAGEAGKGFAVVANEIKDLAQRTAEATDDINRKLKAIQKATGLTVAEIGDVGAAISRVNEIVASIATAVEEQNVSTAGIAENVSQSGAGIAEITDNISQASIATSEVAEEIAGVNVAAEEMTKSSAHVGASARDLSRLAEQLKGIVGRFRV